MSKAICLVLLLVGTWCQELQGEAVDEVAGSDTKDYLKVKSRLTRSRQKTKEVSVITNCKVRNPCRNGGTCDIHATSCRCPSRFTGKYCQIEVLFECDPADKRCFENFENATQISTTNHDGINTPPKGKNLYLFRGEKASLTFKKYFNGSMRIDFDYTTKELVNFFLYTLENGTPTTRFLSSTNNKGKWKSAYVAILNGHNLLFGFAMTENKSGRKDAVVGIANLRVTRLNTEGC